MNHLLLRSFSKNVADIYPGHVRTSTLQKCLLAASSGFVLLFDPARDDLLAALGETTGSRALGQLRSRMLSDSVGQQILRERPVINASTLDMPYLQSLGQNTFGAAYCHYLSKQGFDPNARYPVTFIDDADLAYVMLRYRQIHDFTHILLNMPPNMLGEVAVKWFEFIHTGLPMCLLGGLLGPLRFGPRWRHKYLRDYLPWAVRCGQSSKLLLNVYFEKHWDCDLAELRRMLNIIDPPDHSWEVH